MVTATQPDLIPEAFREIVLERPLGADDLRSFPDDRNRYEIIGGQLIVSPSPSTRHQHIVTQLVTWLNLHLVQNQLGRLYVAPMDVRLSFYDVVQPDVLVVLNDRADIIRDQGIVGAPNLVVEVLSPSSQVTDRVDKVALYGSHGIEEYWIVDPVAETVTVHGRYGDRFAPPAELKRERVLYSVVLPGFVLDLDTIFPDTPLTTSDQPGDSAE